MSLKSFHILFIALSALLSFWCGWMSYDLYRLGGGGGALLVAVLAGLAGIGLVVYGVWFLKRKAKRLE